MKLLGHRARRLASIVAIVLISTATAATGAGEPAGSAPVASEIIDIAKLLEKPPAQCYNHYMTGEQRYCNGGPGEECHYEWYYSDPEVAGCDEGFTDNGEVCGGACLDQQECTNPCL